MASAHRGVVIGGGIAGLAAAIALRKAGYGVTLLEQAPELLPIGAALSLWGNAMAALEWLGADAAVAASAAPIHELGANDQHGRPILHVDLAPAGGTEPFTPHLPTRTLLQSSLLAAATEIDIRLGTAITRVARAATAVTVHLANAAPETADLVVVADGIGSETAAALIGTTPYHAGYGGVLALSDVAPGACRSGEACEYWGRGARFGLFDLGEDRTYWFYMQNEASPAESRLTMGDIAGRLPEWPARLSYAVHATPADRLIPFSIHAKPPPGRLGQGRIVCVGDAAHAMEPNLGQGGCQALEDAVALGVAAARVAPDAVLPMFEHLRLRRVRRFVALSRSAGFMAQSRNHAVVAAARCAARALPDRLTARRIGHLHTLPDYAQLAGSACRLCARIDRHSALSYTAPALYRQRITISGRGHWHCINFIIDVGGTASRDRIMSVAKARPAARKCSHLDRVNFADASWSFERAGGCLAPIRLRVLGSLRGDLHDRHVDRRQHHDARGTRSQTRSVGHRRLVARHGVRMV